MFKADPYLYEIYACINGYYGQGWIVPFFMTGAGLFPAADNSSSL